MDARHVRFVGVRDQRHRFTRLRRKLDAHGFKELARRNRAQATDHQVDLDPFDSFGRLQEDGALLEVIHHRVLVQRHLAGLDRRLELAAVRGFGLVEFFPAIDDRHVVAVLHERKGVFDAGVARSDDDDLLALEVGRVVELMRNMGKVVAFAAKAAQAALDANRHHDVRGIDDTAALGVQFECADLPLDADQFVFGADRRLHVGALEGGVPLAQHILPRVLFESHVEIRLQTQAAGLGHHELAFLVTLDRVGERGAIEQQVRHAALGGLATLSSLGSRCSTCCDCGI